MIQRPIIILSLLIFLCLPGVVKAQSIEIVEAQDEVVGSFSSSLKAGFSIRNRSDKTILLKIKRSDKQISTGSSHYFCWGDDCFSKATDELPNSIILAPGQITTKFQSVLEAGITESQSSVKFTFFDKNNPDDFIEHEVFYKVFERKPEAIMLKNKSIQISNAYPNPANEFAAIDYRIIDDSKEIKIVIHNVLGGSIAEYELKTYESSVVIDTEKINPGVYFYSLYIDNDNVITKKFIVKH